MYMRTYLPCARFNTYISFIDPPYERFAISVTHYLIFKSNGIYFLIFQAFSDQWQQRTRNTPVKQLNLKIMYISNSVIFLKDISKTICLSVYSDLSVQRYSKPRNLYEAEK